METRKTIRKTFRDFFWTVFTKLSRKKATEYRMNRNVGYKVNLDDPKTLNEKIQWLKLNTYYKNPLVTQCSDKYLVRDFVKEKIGDSTLIELFGVYDTPEDIDWDKLPKEFVLKCNHGSGGNIICHDKDKLDKDEVKRKLSKWLKDDYGPSRVEFAYDDIKRKIIAEKFIETEDGLPPKDYKIFCSYGKPKFLFVASDRVGNNTKFDFFTPEWEWLPVKNSHENAKEMIEKPKDFDKMLEYASRLSAEFPIVRVDFYYEFGKIIFGELTFLHFGGVRPFTPIKYDRIFGDLLPIDKEFRK